MNRETLDDIADPFFRSWRKNENRPWKCFKWLGIGTNITLSDASRLLVLENWNKKSQVVGQGYIYTYTSDYFCKFNMHVFSRTSVIHILCELTDAHIYSSNNIYWTERKQRKRQMLTLVLLNPDIPYLYKPCRSRSVGFWRSQLIWLSTVCHSECELMPTIWILESDWMKIRSRCAILIYSAWQGLINIKIRIQILLNGKATFTKKISEMKALDKSNILMPMWSNLD